MRRKKQEMVVVEEVKPLIATPTDTVVLRMSSLADKIKYLDNELYTLFEQWKDMQSECLRVGIQVDVLRSKAMEAAYITWLSTREPDHAPTTVNEWPLNQKPLELSAESGEYARNGD